MTAKKYWWGACAILYLAFFCVNAWQSARSPMYNWDMIGYMGAVETYSTKDPQQIYDKTVERLKKIYSPHGVKSIIEKPVTSNAKAFYQQLPYYTVKPLFVSTIYVLHQFGAPMHVTSYMLQIIGFLVIGALCIWFRPRSVDIGLWAFAVMAFCVIGRWSVIDTLPWTTPDMICIAFFLLGFCGWVYKRSLPMLAAGLLLAQLTRPDMMMLNVFLCAFFAFDTQKDRRLDRKFAAILAAVCIGTYFLVNHLAGSYGWRNLFDYVFFNRIAYPADMPADFTFQEYWSVLKTGVEKMLLEDGRVQLLLALSVVCSVMYVYFPAVGNPRFVWLLWLGWISLAARFVMLPAYWEDRYYLPNYFIMLFALAELYGGLWKNRRVWLALLVK